jgi:hypothetical protein
MRPGVRLRGGQTVYGFAQTPGSSERPTFGAEVNRGDARARRWRD